MMIGFFGSYLLGLPPSRTPPCGVARSVDVGDAADEDAAFVMAFDTTEDMEDMLIERTICHGSHRVLCDGESDLGGIII